MALFVICLAILIIIVLALVLPVSVEMTVKFSGRTDVSVRIYYFFHRLGWASVAQAGKSTREKPGESEKPVTSFWARLYMAARVRGVWNRFWLLARRLVSSISIRRLEADLRVSLVDDYYTGMLAGLMIPLVLFLNARFSGDLKFQPAFEEDFILDGYMGGVVQVRPVSLLFPVLAFALSRPGWTAVRIMAAGR